LRAKTEDGLAALPSSCILARAVVIIVSKSVGMESGRREIK